MPRVFISTLQLTDYRDETLATLDLIDTFIAKNWHVDVYCHQYDAVIKVFIEQRSASERLFVTDNAEHIFGEEYDLLWLQYASLNASVLNRLLNGGMTTNIIFDHQSLHNRESTPADIQLENRLADKVLITLPRLVGFLRDGGIEPSVIQTFPQPVPDWYFAQRLPHEPSSLKKLLIVVDVLTPVLSALPNELSSYSVNCDIVSREQWLHSKSLQNYDAILASGRVAQYALCAGMPIYLSRDNQFVGYVCTELAEDNIFREETSGKTLSAKELAEDITLNFLKAIEYIRKRSGYYAEDWRFSASLPALLETLPAPTLKTITDQELQRLALHNLTLSDKTKPFYSVDKWLSERLISPTRRNLLQAFIQAYPDVGNTAIVVMAHTHSDEPSILSSLHSIQAQFYAASEIYVLAPTAIDIPAGQDSVIWIAADSDAISPINAVIAQTSASYLLVLRAGEQLLPHASLLLAEYRLRVPSARAFYFDEAIIKDGKADNPMLKPECNIDMLRSYPYIGSNLALEVSGLRQMGNIATIGYSLELHDVIWQLIEQEGPQALGHIPEVLVYTQHALFDWLRSDEVITHYPEIVQRHLARCHVEANVSAKPDKGICHIQYQHTNKPLVSIIIPTRDHLAVISRCIETLMEHTQYPHYELLIVDNQSTDPGACQYLAQLAAMGLSQIQVLSWPHAFNFSAINNFAAEQANGDVLLFLNNDTEVIDGTWLAAMLQHALRPEIGIVGAKLEFEDGRIQHGGIVLGMNDSAGIVFQGKASDSAGYMNRLFTTHNVSAVSAACMMMRREVFVELGGFNEQQYPIYFGDVDLALKARQQGYLVVWTPDARVVHLGGASRLLQQHFHLSPLPQRTDIDALYDQWLPQLSSDPYYHPAYGKHAPGFALTPEMARCHRPLPGRPLPVVMANHADWHGCGHYRVIFPFQALEREMHIEGGLKLGAANLVDVADMVPDVVIVQAAAGAQMPEIAARYRKYTQAAVVAEFDDYILNVPINSGNRKKTSQQLIKNFRRALESVDWVVVSTPALADAYSDYHSDIRVASNRLPTSWWGGLTSLRQQGRKPRVGWAGGSSHKGDLAILRSVVKALEDEVEWVFMGMKPEGVKCEFHSGVPIEYYPQKTASLNLDLALVPLENNHFNECKSNLRLLELGVCGIPVICTDIEPYRCNLPVTRVDNRFKDWMDAIRMHLADMDATAKMGDHLRDAVHQDWMLEGDGLTDWLQAWLSK
ncbi:glycosyltransferase [Pectobacterium versatile]|uniref:glycosyltransferase n=1 Tax=Pectobacterium versatile TaxID=2488639 RepID=UPI001CCFEA8D|nr:glycosyltransferase [Pectobacterium versatile]